MLIKQVSIFVENRAGRLAEITEVMAKENINICALSIADTTNFGILRIIVDDLHKVERILKENGMTLMITSVVSVFVDDKPGGLAKILRILADNDIAIEYMYDISYEPESSSGKKALIMKIEKEQYAIDVLRAAGYKGIEVTYDV